MKRSRLQSQEAPSRFNWPTIAPPDSAFHAQTRSRNASRPIVRRSGLLALGELALDHHLRGDAGVVGARLPQHVAALHAPIAAQHVLQRVVERMAHMQVAGDVGRRDDDAERLGVGALGTAGAEGLRFLPIGGDAALHGGEIESLVHRQTLGAKSGA